jgi:hypothetical protein
MLLETRELCIRADDAIGEITASYVGVERRGARRHEARRRDQRDASGRDGLAQLRAGNRLDAPPGVHAQSRAQPHR